MEQINLNLIPGRSLPVCHVSQYDVGRTIRFNLFEGDQVFALATGDTAEVHVRKPDSTVVTAALTVVNSQTYLDVTTTQQMDAVAGSNLCEIQLKRSGKTLGTLNFIMEVEPDPLNNGSTSASDIKDLAAQVTALAEAAVAPFIEDVNQIHEDFYGSRDAVYTSGGYINTGSVNVGDVVNMTPVSNANYVYAVMTCAEGDAFIYSGASGNAPRCWAFVKSDYTLISVDIANRTRLNEIIIAPANSAYVIFNSQAAATHSATKYPVGILDSDLIRIGTGTSITSISKGFDIARATGKGVIITPGTYDLATYGLTSSSTGLVAPKKIIAYGVTFTLTLPTYSSSNPSCSPLNIDKIPECEIYGLTIHCKNCRYCIHDECYNYDAPYYHHVFKDLTLIHESDTGSTGLWVAPRAIGGGIGNGGLIEIVNCLTYSTASEDINYHSKSNEAQTGEALVIIKDSAMRKNASVSNGGTLTSFMNTMLVSNCITGKNVPDGSTYNFKKISWNMQVLSGASEFDTLFNLLGE